MPPRLAAVGALRQCSAPAGRQGRDRPARGVVSSPARRIVFVEIGLLLARLWRFPSCLLDSYTTHHSSPSHETPLTFVAPFRLATPTSAALQNPPPSLLSRQRLDLHSTTTSGPAESRTSLDLLPHKGRHEGANLVRSIPQRILTRPAHNTHHRGGAPPEFDAVHSPSAWPCPTRAVSPTLPPPFDACCKGSAIVSQPCLGGTPALSVARVSFL